MGILSDPGLQARYGGSNASVGLAQGKIVIDTQSLAQQRGVVIREARLMGDSLKRELGDQTDAGVRQAENALGRLQTSLQSVQRGFSLALGAITGLGVASAQSVKSLEARFRLLAGSEEQATKQLNMLREMAEKTNQPFLQVVEGATAIMPALRNSNAELSTTLLLVQRLAILDPAQGVTGAAFAIREFLNGEYLSLVRRLELDRKRLMAIRDQSEGDQAKMIAGLSEYVAELGVTEQSLYDVGATGVNAFRVMRDEGTQTLAEFFEPFLNDFLIPITRALSDMLRELRAVNPELQKLIGISAGLAATSALAQRGLPLIGAIPGGGAIARAGGVAASVYGGAQLGVFATRQLGNAGLGGGFERFRGRSQSDVISELTRILKQVAGIMILGGAEAAKALIDIVYLLEEPINTLKGYLDDLGGKIGDVVDLIGSLTPETKMPTGPPILPGGPIPNIIGASVLQTFFAGGRREPEAAGPEGLWGPSFKAFEQDTADLTASLLDAGYTMDQVNVILENMADQGTEVIQTQEDQESAADKAKDSIDDFTKELLVSLGIIEENRNAVDILVGAISNLTNVFQMAADQARKLTPSRELTITDELLDDWEKLQADLADLDAEYKTDTEEELASHEERKADIIASYQARVAEVIESEGIRYERALRTAHRREMDIRDGMVEDLTDSDADLAETLTELHTDYREGEEDALEDHLAKMADIREAGQDALIRAARKLDVQGVIDAKHAMERRLDDEKDSYQDQRDARKERLEEAVADAMEAHDEQLRIAKESADEQIALLWERFYEEEAIRQEDTQRQLDKLQRDNQQRLDEQDRQHQERMGDLRMKHGQERSALLTHFAQTLMDENQHLGNLRQIEETHRKQVAKDLEKWWQDNQRFYLPQGYLTPAQTQRGTEAATAVRGFFQRFQTGGQVMHTGLGHLEAGEEVLRRDTAMALRRMMGGAIPQAGLVGAVAGGGRNVSMTMGDMVLQFPERAAGWNEAELASYFRQELEAFLVEMAA